MSRWMPDSEVVRICKRVDELRSTQELTITQAVGRFGITVRQFEYMRIRKQKIQKSNRRKSE